MTCFHTTIDVSLLSVSVLYDSKVRMRQFMLLSKNDTQEKNENI